jgi:hypothetical protein
VRQYMGTLGWEKIVYNDDEDAAHRVRAR